MIFRWLCNKCGKEITTGKDRLKVCGFTPYEYTGDLCRSCWNKITGESAVVKNQQQVSN